MEQNQKKQKKQIIIGVVFLVIVVIVALLLYNRFAPKAVKGAKSIVVEVVNKEGESKEYKYDTDSEYLGDVLIDNKLVEGEQGPYGLYIKAVNGEKVDDSKQEWWCITRNKEQLNTSADLTPIEDGEHYEIVFTVGY